MSTSPLRTLASLAVAALALLGLAPATGAAPSIGPSAMASMYVADFVSTAATAVAMNDAGDVTGTSYRDTGCGSFCLPPQDTVVWRDGQRIVLPSIPGLSGIYVRDINAQGWVVGIAGLPGTTTHAVLWRPSGTTYTATDLGTLPGTSISEAVGIDDQGRVVGWSTTATFPPNGSPFLWSEATGMVDLSAQGYPDVAPLAISPGGTVATLTGWYRLGDPGGATTLPPPPAGFLTFGGGAAINDAGDQARLLTRTGGQNLIYPFRLPHGGTWQQLSLAGTGNLSTVGIGGINDALDVSLTVQSTGMIAPGPSGVAQPLTSLVSPAYPGAAVVNGGPINASGQVLATMIIGASPRVVRLTPAAGCATSCIRVSALQVTGRFVQDPKHPGQCAPGFQAYNLVRARLTVTSETGAPLAGVSIQGRFLDGYWTNRPVTATTNAQGVVQLTNRGPCGVGTVTFLVDQASLGTRTFDRTSGVVTGSVIPQ